MTSNELKTELNRLADLLYPVAGLLMHVACSNGRVAREPEIHEKVIELEEAREQDPRIQLTPEQARGLCASPIWEGDEVVTNPNPKVEGIG
jgi:hypothetical protein